MKNRNRRFALLLIAFLTRTEAGPERIVEKETKDHQSQEYTTTIKTDFYFTAPRRLVQPLVETGDREAQFKLGLLYEQGMGNENAKEALQCLQNT